MHAEVQSLNYIYNAVPNPATLNLADVSIATIKLGPSSAAGNQGAHSWHVRIAVGSFRPRLMSSPGGNKIESGKD